MRNTLLVLLIGPLLFGCLAPEKSNLPGGADSATDAQVGNTAPTITGVPSSDILYGDLYDFEPSATDSDGDKLTFSVQNKPQWASFDASTGRLSGRPTLGDVGVYGDIVISVSDGRLSASLPSYSVAVSQTANGVITLSWIAPTQNSDGSTLTDLAGYKIYYGEASRNYQKEILIDNQSITTYVVDQLSPGTYYFSATAFNSSGVESAFSGEAVKTVN